MFLARVDFIKLWDPNMKQSVNHLHVCDCIRVQNLFILHSRRSKLCHLKHHTCYHIIICCLLFCLVSKPAPYWESTAVKNGEFVQLKLSDFQGKYLVFFFYPLDLYVLHTRISLVLFSWVIYSCFSTFVCPTEILAFSDRIHEFRKINAEVVACSVDSHFTHLAWINTPRKEGGLGQVKIPLISDLSHSISKDYGVFLDDLGHTLR